jgi:outer membrane protein OmpA-like peptidoglycan-associated protein
MLNIKVTNKMKRYIATIIISVISVVTFAQQQPPVEFQLWGGGGISELQYKFKGGNPSIGFGGHTGLGFTFFFNNWVGLNLGGEVSWYNSKIKADGLSAYMPNWYDDYMNDQDPQQAKYSKYNLTSTLEKYTEKIKAMTVNIPIGVQFQTQGIYQYYFIAGIKVGIPIKSQTTYSASDATVLNSAYYPDLDNTIDENTPGVNSQFTGFGRFENKEVKEQFNMKLSWMATFETGIKFHLAQKVFLYWGLYCDYGINDVREVKGLDFIQHEDGKLIGKNFVPNSLIASNAAPDELFAKRVVPLSAGMKLRLSFGLGKVKSIASTAAKIADALTPEQKAELERQRQLDAAEKRRLANENEELRQRLNDALKAQEAIVVEVEPEEPHTVTFSGKIIDSATNAPLNANVFVYDQDNILRGAAVSDEALDGYYEIKDLPQGKNYRIEMNCPTYAQKTVENLAILEGPKDVKKTVDGNLEKLAVGQKFVLKNIFFSTAKWDIRPESWVEIDKVYQLMLDNPNMSIEISGHTDNVGSAASNKTLSQNRANAIRQALINKGIDAKRVTAHGYGLEQPIATNDTEEGRQINRRVEFKITAL